MSLNDFGFVIYFSEHFVEHYKLIYTAFIRKNIDYITLKKENHAHVLLIFVVVVIVKCTNTQLIMHTSIHITLYPN